MTQKVRKECALAAPRQRVWWARLLGGSTTAKATTKLGLVGTGGTSLVSWGTTAKATTSALTTVALAITAKATTAAAKAFAARGACTWGGTLQRPVVRVWVCVGCVCLCVCVCVCARAHLRVVVCVSLSGYSLRGLNSISLRAASYMHTQTMLTRLTLVHSKKRTRVECGA